MLRFLFSALLISVTFPWSVCSAQSFNADVIFGSGYEDSNTVEWIQRHGSELDGKSVYVDKVYVTASLRPNQSMFVQESADLSGSEFPRFDGIRLYNPGFVYTPGSCVAVLGNVSNFQGSVQISPVTELADTKNGVRVPSLATSAQGRQRTGTPSTARQEIFPMARMKGMVEAAGIELREKWPICSHFGRVG